MKEVRNWSWNKPYGSGLKMIGHRRETTYRNAGTGGQIGDIEPEITGSWGRADALNVADDRNKDSVSEIRGVA